MSAGHAAFVERAGVAGNSAKIMCRKNERSAGIQCRERVYKGEEYYGRQGDASLLRRSAPLKRLVEVWQVGDLRNVFVFEERLGWDEVLSQGREEDVLELKEVCRLALSIRQDPLAEVSALKARRTLCSISRFKLLLLLR